MKSKSRKITLKVNNENYFDLVTPKFGKIQKSKMKGGEIFYEIDKQSIHSNTVRTCYNLVIP